MKRNKFKIGDAVTVNLKYSSHNDLKGVGTVVKIGSSNGNGRTTYSVTFPDKVPTFNFYSYELNHAIKEKLNKGDWVIINYPDKQCYGTIYRVITSPFTCYCVRLISTGTKKQNVCVGASLVKKYPGKYFPGDKVYLTESAKKWILENKFITNRQDINLDDEFTIYRMYMTDPLNKSNININYELKEISSCIRFYEDDDLVALTTSKETTESQTKTSKDQLQVRWKLICDDYLKCFCERHGYRYEPYMWIGDDPGTIIEVNDMVINFNDIRYDVDNNVDPEMFEKWYWKDLDVYQLLGKKFINYPSFCKGAPEPITDEQLQKAHKLYKTINDTKNEFKKYVEELGGNINNTIF